MSEMHKEIIIELRRIMKMIEDVPEGSEDVKLLDDLATDVLNDLMSLVESLESA